MKTSDVKLITLNNGIKIPSIGFGVFQIPKEETADCVKKAISIGYRLIDTAQAYHNEKETGIGIKLSGVKREEIFLTTKVWVSNYERCYESVIESLKRLDTSYLDLILLHQPFGNYYKAYQDLERLYKEKKVRNIGVSNFWDNRIIDLCMFNEIKPMVNQIEINPFHQRIEDRFYNDKYKVVSQAWAPFAEGKNGLFTNPTLVDIGKKYNKTPAQVILRWLVQSNVVALCKTVNENRMKENFDIFDFELSKQDLDKIVILNKQHSEFRYHHSAEGAEFYGEISNQIKIED